MNNDQIIAATNSLIYYMPYIILVFGNFGCICNFLTFTNKQLRSNSCGWYSLMSALFDFLYINVGLFTKLATDQYGNTLQNVNLAWCRIRIFLTWTLPCIATGYLVLASLDRCLSTSTNTSLRSFSQIKVAHRMTCVPIILYSLTTSHQFIFYDLRPKCSALPGTYSYFLSFYSIIWTSFVPQICMFVFAILTFRNIQQSRQRLSTTTPTNNRTNSHLITITLVQVLCSSILLNIRSSYFAYTRFSTSIVKDDHRKLVESLILEITSYIFYANFAKSFYVNTLSSKLFRQVFSQRLRRIYTKFICRRQRVQPSTQETQVHKKY